MKVTQDDLWLCPECTIYACNGDLSGIDSDARAKIVEDGVDGLGPHLVLDDDSETGEGHLEFAWKTCDACRSRLGGEYYRFAILGE